VDRGALVAEHAGLAGVPMPKLERATQEKLASLIAPFSSACRIPLTMGASLLRQAPREKRFEALDSILADPNIDVLIIGIPGAPDSTEGRLYRNGCSDIRAYAPRRKNRLSPSGTPS